ncbi:MAG TPA: GAF domain-containing protein [Anaerolineales bacterium]|nr:GAF domain-containing protein [Anaerolineales bacterium]
MLKRVSTILTPPVFLEDENKTRKARYAHVIAIAFLAIAVAFEGMLRIFGNYVKLSILDLSLFMVVAICVVGLMLLRQGHVQLTSILLVSLTWIATNGLAATGFGARDSSYIINFAIVLMAGLLLSWQASLIITILSALSGFALAYAEQYGLIAVGPYPVTSFARDIAFVFVINGVLIFLLINGLENALKRSKMSLKELESANSNLNYTQNELQNRSAELLIANKQLENRTKKLQAIATVTRTSAIIQDFDLLLGSITSTTSKELGYYHVGLFLLDEQRKFAILRATNTDGGLRMLSRGYQVALGQKGIVGFVAQTGQPQIVPGEGQDSVVLNNPDLPETRSQIVLPLKSGGQVIGVLDIQSVEANAFVEDDLSTLSILADQVAITIQNSLLYEQSQNALREADTASVQNTSEAWKRYEKAVQTRGYRYDGIKSEPLKEVRQSNQARNSLLIPIQLRGQTIGRFKLHPSDSSREWTDDELVMVKATAERVALALEGARLLDEAQKRAVREAFLSEVATKLSASFQLESILRDTVQELGQTLKNSTVTFQLMNPSESNAPAIEKTDGNSAQKGMRSRQ